MNTKKILIGLFAGALVYSCEPEFEDSIPTPKKGSADFSKYIAIGNSLTAGYRDGGVFDLGQKFAFPNLLADKFKTVGGGEFKTPYIPSGKSLLVSDGKLLDARYLLSVGKKKPELVTNGAYTLDKLEGDFQNLGAPGAKSYHLGVEGYGNQAGLALGKANPYYVRFAKTATSSVMGDAMAQKPTFFSLWIGNNDVLGFATNGGDGQDQKGNLDASKYASSDISDPNLVAGAIDGYLKLLIAGAKGVLLNVPDVTSIPYFDVVPYNPVKVTKAEADQLNAGFAAYNGGLEAAKTAGALSEDELKRRKIVFKEGANPVVILDESLTDLTKINAALVNMRFATSEDKLTLPSSSFIGTLVGEDATKKNGVTVPLADKWVLTKDEVKMANDAVAAINAGIKGLAEKYKDNVVLVDANAILKGIKKDGYKVGGLTFNSTFGTGGLFSLDGVHITGLGNGIITNHIIEAINTKFGSSLVKYTDEQLLNMPQNFIKE